MAARRISFAMEIIQLDEKPCRQGRRRFARLLRGRMFKRGRHLPPAEHLENRDGGSGLHPRMRETIVGRGKIRIVFCCAPPITKPTGIVAGEGFMETIDSQQVGARPTGSGAFRSGRLCMSRSPPIWSWAPAGDRRAHRNDRRGSDPGECGDRRAFAVRAGRRDRPNPAGADDHRNPPHRAVSFHEGALACEQFLIVGLIASIRRMLVITLESSQAQETGNRRWSFRASSIPR